VPREQRKRSSISYLKVGGMQACLNLMTKSIREYDARFWPVSLNHAPGYWLKTDSVRSPLSDQLT
jgi:hypothetical protein